MVNFNVSAGGLSLRALNEKDLATFDCHVGDLQTFEYISQRNPAVRRHGARAATGSSVAHALLTGSQVLNVHALTVWLRRWLSANAGTIEDRLAKNGHDVFIVIANYLTARGPEGTTVHSAHSIHVTDTVPDVASVNQVLSYAKIYGPAAQPTPHNDRHVFNSAYLIGTRAGAEDVAAFDRLRPLLERPDASILERYGL